MTTVWKDLFLVIRDFLSQTLIFDGLSQRRLGGLSLLCWAHLLSIPESFSSPQDITEFLTKEARRDN